MLSFSAARSIDKILYNKFILEADGQRVFNNTNFTIVNLLMILFMSSLLTSIGVFSTLFTVLIVMNFTLLINNNVFNFVKESLLQN